MQGASSHEHYNNHHGDQDLSVFVCLWSLWLMCDVLQKPANACYRSVSLCKDEHASIWRAKSAMSFSGQLLLCDHRRTLAGWKTG